MNLGLSLSLGGMRAGGGWPPSITSSDGDPASLIDNGDNTVDVVIDGVTVGTITRAQVTAGGWITVVAPVAGMSGDDVVLTTTGYVIYVGNVSIETDVEVLADGVVVGTALPFDATAYPDELLEVRWSFTVGFGADLVITDEARAFTVKVIQFRNGYVGLTRAASPAAWPSAQRTRQMTGVMRVVGTVGSTVLSPNMPQLVTSEEEGLRITGLGGSSSARLQFSAAGLVASRINAVADGARSISIMAAIDIDGGLPGGRMISVWLNVDNGTWFDAGGYVGVGSFPNIAAAGLFNTNPNGTNTSGDVDLINHIWFANVAIDPATNWSNFFNADGSVKDLGTDGIIGGVTPVVYAVGDDFVTRTNRGSGGGSLGFNAARTAPTVVNL